MANDWTQGNDESLMSSCRFAAVVTKSVLWSRVMFMVQGFSLISPSISAYCHTLTPAWQGFSGEPVREDACNQTFESVKTATRVASRATGIVYVSIASIAAHCWR